MARSSSVHAILFVAAGAIGCGGSGSTGYVSAVGTPNGDVAASQCVELSTCCVDSGLSAAQKHQCSSVSGQKVESACQSSLASFQGLGFCKDVGHIDPSGVLGSGTGTGTGSGDQTGNGSGNGSGNQTGGNQSGQTLGCSGYSQCYASCNLTATDDASFASCTSDCDAQSTQAASATFQNAELCEESYCLCGSKNMLDTSSGSCTSASGTSTKPYYRCGLSSDGSSFTEADGSDIDPSGDSLCLTCLNDSSADLFATDCSDPSSADCNPTLCASTIDACLADTP